MTDARTAGAPAATVGRTARARTLATACLLSFALAACDAPDPVVEEAASGANTPAAMTERRDAEGTALTATRIRSVTGSVDGERISAADTEPHNWLAHGRTYAEERYSPLDQIDAGNVQELGLAWSWETGTTRGLEASPIVVDGVMYTTGSWSWVYAHDARTGELLWSHNPQVPREWGKNACCDVVNRGVAVWEGKVFVGTIDGRLVALDAGTGEVLWETLTIDRERPYTITGAPRVVKGRVIIGNGGAEYGVRGYVTAYDARTGEQAWRFYTVPGDPSEPFENAALEVAATTWRGGEWWKIGGGGTVWDSMAYDPELDLLYIGTGNGSPWNKYIRSPGGGDNLYLSSIVAMDPDTGELEWYYQTTPGDSWDYTATQHMILADLEIDGVLRKVIMQAPKNGFFYVIDRTNGEFISAENYVPVNWASHVDPETGRPVQTEDGQYGESPKLVFPAPYGGHNWHPMAFNRDTGLVYIPALDIPFMYGQDNAFRYAPGEWNTGTALEFAVPPRDPAQEAELRKMVKGHLAAWDPVAQKEVWRVQHDGSWNGGVLTTAGNLVFQGRADGMFAAYAADNGELLWEFPVYTGIIAPPVTYAVDGEQYVAVMAGWGGAFALASGIPPREGNVTNRGRLLTFKLGGADILPEPERRALPADPPEIPAPPQVVAQGETLYHQYCQVCHGAGATGSGVLPDLRYADADTHRLWKRIVLEGAYTEKGMVAFDHVLDESGAEAIQAYVVHRARTTLAGAPEDPEPDVSAGL